MPTMLKRSKPKTPEEVMQRYPRLTSHLICASLGYFTPGSAAGAILRHSQGKPYYCEWYDDWESKSRGELTLLDVGRKALNMAFHFRHHHTGYMAEYRNARALVDHVVAGGEGPMFASWF
jgi:hypothetical protein